MNSTKLSMFILASTIGSFAFAQTNTIKGRILDDTHTPLSNVRVQIQNNENQNTITDNQGNYSIIVPKNETMILISKEGFETQSIPIKFENNENNITYVDITLNPTEKLIDEVRIYDNPSLVTNSAFNSRKKLDNIAGGTSLAHMRNLNSQRSQTLKDALQREPGVIIQEFFGGNDQPRMNIRGSGIHSNPQSRGISLLQDGIPINFTDGSYIIGVLEPQASNLVEIYRGANALEYGSTTLGGAINFVTKNGYNASPLSLKLEGGSFDYYNVAVSSGFSKGKNDGFASLSYNHSNGFRDYNSSRRLNALINVGRRFTDKFESRLYASFTDLYFDIPGPLTRQQMKDNPKQSNRGIKFTFPYAAGPNVLRDKPNRNSQIVRVGSKSVYQIDKNNLLSAMLYFQFAEDQFTYPISYGIRRDLNNDYGIRLTYEHKSERNNLLVGWHLSTGSIRQNGFVNKYGKRAGLFSKHDLHAKHNVLYFSDTYKFSDKLSANVSLQASWDSRKLEDLYPYATRPVIFFHPQNGNEIRVPLPNKTVKVNGNFNYFGLNPKVGLIYKVQDNIRLFTNFSRSYEPPTFLDIISTSGGFNPNGSTPEQKLGTANPNSSPTKINIANLKAQKASTFEIGTKGNLGNKLLWNLSLYNTWVQDEIFMLASDYGIGGVTTNAPYNTIHRGLETAIQSTLAQNIFSKAEDELKLFVNYNWADFKFDGGKIYKGKQVAGIPKHYSYIALNYKHPIGLSAELNLESLWSKTPTDNRNTVYQDPYHLIGAKLSYKFNKWTFYVQGNNLANKNYASSYLIRDIVNTPRMPLPPNAPKPTNEDAATFIPGVGTNFVAGVNFIF